MARPRLSEKTRQRLLEEGVSAFLYNGFHGTGLKEVLDRVKVPKGSFYNYFESKEAFAVAAIHHYAACFAAKMEQAISDASDPYSGLRHFFEALMADFETAGYVGGCLIANLGGELEGSELCRESLATAFRQWRDRVAEVLRQSQQRGLVRADLDAGDLADLLTEAWEGAVIRMKIERSLEPPRRVLRRLLDDYFRP
ncbi:MAG: TetR family transcriptional regulator C-terminal domain-containing protein [Candidatus Competibacteraceae bacterium]|nr:TetR family transcriptional regulator C-terminal domain-containing protein [Candidatus Competibacteraceae bacterium]